MQRANVWATSALVVLLGGCAGSEEGEPNGSSRQAAQAETRPEALRGSVMIDGKVCADEASQNAWLNRAPGDNRWTLYLDGPECDVTVQIGGVTDKPYPQTGVIAWEGQEYIKVFTKDVNTEFTNSWTLTHLSAEGAEGTVEIGPTGDAPTTRIVARGKVAAWTEENSPKMREVVIDVALPPSVER